MTTSSSVEERMASIPPFGLRLRPDLKMRLEAAARANGRSLNSEITARLERSLPIDDRVSPVSPNLTLEERLAAVEQVVLASIVDPRLDQLDQRVRLVEAELTKGRKPAGPQAVSEAPGSGVGISLEPAPAGPPRRPKSSTASSFRTYNKPPSEP
jgi:hypothetical protein